MRIGTAAPTQEQLDRVRHYFVGQLNLDEYYSAAKYEQEVLQLTSELFKTHNTLILSGGSMMYIDAVCNGIDDIPTVDEEVRATLAKRLQEEGLEKLLAELRLADPEHYDFVDHKNAKRVVHALEVCYTTGKPYSSFLTRKTLRCGASTTQTADRPFRILKIGLERPREELFARINSRVDDMINSGLLHEAMTLLPHRHENALNTVGYKEMFNVLDGTWELPMAIERLKKNTRVYAKKQMTWFKHDTGVTWFHPNDKDGIIKHINENLNIGE
jgi:tRNA dimethylallyltransferase